MAGQAVGAVDTGPQRNPTVLDCPAGRILQLGRMMSLCAWAHENHHLVDGQLGRDMGRLAKFVKAGLARFPRPLRKLYILTVAHALRVS